MDFTAVLFFFIAGLLYLLRFERVDNLGAYSIPSETGLLIPSVFNKLSTIVEQSQVTKLTFVTFSFLVVSVRSELDLDLRSC